MASNLEMWKAMSIGRPWVLGIQNQVVSYCGAALCDPLLQSSVSALEPFRYATGIFSWDSVATTVPGGPPAAPNQDGNDLQIPTGDSLVLFQSGIGETIPGGWWPQTISDTDTFKGGAPVDRGQMFLVTGLTTNALDCFQRGGSGASSTDPKLYSNWLQMADDGPGYSFLIQKFHINYTSILFTFGDTGCSYRLGVCAFWPVWGDPRGSQTVGNTATNTPGMYLPFTTSVCIAARDDVRQLSLTIAVGQTGRVQNNGTQSTISGSLPDTEGTINELNDGTVHCPFRVMIVGYIVCVPNADSCGVPTLTPDEVIAARNLLGATSGNFLPPVPGGGPRGQ